MPHFRNLYISALSVIIVAALAGCGPSRKTAAVEADEIKPGWDSPLSDAFMEDCMATVNIGLGKEEYCSCMLDQLSRMYSYAEAQKLSDAALAEVAESCMPE